MLLRRCKRFSLVQRIALSKWLTAQWPLECSETIRLQSFTNKIYKNVSFGGMHRYTTESDTEKQAGGIALTSGEGENIQKTEIWSASTRQKKFGGRVMKAIQAVLMSPKHEHLKEALIEDAGMCIKDVRMSPDHMKAFILWETYKGEDDREWKMQAQSIVNRHAGALRRAVAKALGAKHVPYLEFRQDRDPLGCNDAHSSFAHQQRLEEVMDSLKSKNDDAERDF